MTCRHGYGDPSCSATIARMEAQPTTPDKEKYTIEAATRVGPHLILEVTYPNCAKCAFEGRKVLVYLNVPETAALRWRCIDPHFRANVKSGTLPTEAPSPAARFPPTPEGRQDALEYAQRKLDPVGHGTPAAIG